MLGMKHSTATVRQVPVTMAPSWSVYLFPVCLGVMSAKQTDWEHICTPHSSTEASPDTEEQAGLLAAPCLSAKFPALLKTCGRAWLWQGERSGNAQLTGPGSCLWERGARLSSPVLLQGFPGDTKPGTAWLCSPHGHAETTGARAAAQMLWQELPAKSFPQPCRNPKSPRFLS